MKVNEIKAKYEKKMYALKIEEATELINLVPDKGIEELYKKYPEVFGPLSHKIDEVNLYKAIDILYDHLKGLSREEYDVMTKDEIMDYFTKLFKKSDIDIYDLIKQLE